MFSTKIYLSLLPAQQTIEVSETNLIKSVCGDISGEGAGGAGDEVEGRQVLGSNV